jgi:hypothetical protein
MGGGGETGPGESLWHRVDAGGEVESLPELPVAMQSLVAFARGNGSPMLTFDPEAAMWSQSGTHSIDAVNEAYFATVVPAYGLIVFVCLASGASASCQLFKPA